MPSKANERFIRAADPIELSQPAVDDRHEPGGEVPFSDEQLDRWAKLLADGEVEFPSDLPAAQVEPLVAQVRRRRRQRLIRWLASEIARYLKRDEESRKGGIARDDTV